MSSSALPGPIVHHRLDPAAELPLVRDPGQVRVDADRNPPQDCRRCRRVVRWGRRVALVPLLIALVVCLVCASLRWIDPPTTMFMQRDIYVPSYQYVPLSDISPNLAAAAIVHEDPAQVAVRLAVLDATGQVQSRYVRPATVGFLERQGGTDWHRLLVRIDQTRLHGDDVGGSTTLDQQLVKNLFLTANRSPWRKAAVEPLVAEVLGRVVSKSRQIEMYLNIAEFGPGIWGACAASWYYYDKAPRKLTMAEAVDLVSVLPSPKRFRLADGGGVQPLHSPKGATYDAYLLLEYARKYVPRQIETDHVRQQMLNADINSNELAGACESPPAGVQQNRLHGPTLKVH